MAGIFVDTDSETRDTGDRPWSVAELNGQIKTALSNHFRGRGKVRVVGEVSNLSDRSHWFFTLRDAEADAAVSCVMFASAARAVGFPVSDGMRVVASGRVDFYEATGRTQLYVDRLEPVGEGARELALRRLLEELRGLGYFDPDRKRPLPAVPRKIAVVTSRSAAALQDVIDTTRRRWAGCALSLVDVRVQGPDAAPQVAAALRWLSDQGQAHGIDAVILTRGGGSLEDLWAFNERDVADAVFDCTLPVVAAIGHETDTTVAELVADARCATPTQAAMTLVPDRAVLAEQVDQLAAGLGGALRRRLERARYRLDMAANHPRLRDPRGLTAPPRERVERLSARLHEALPRRLAAERQRVAALSRTLEAVAPQRVLERGYSVTLGPDGKALAAAADATPGATLTTVLADGRVRSVVEGEGAKPRRPRRLKPLRGDDGTPTLFA
ncbi:MAG: exodeoxyribonuclease VII large subunit [Planctomycetota bacterium]